MGYVGLRLRLCCVGGCLASRGSILLCRAWSSCVGRWRRRRCNYRQRDGGYALGDIQSIPAQMCGDKLPWLEKRKKEGNQKFTSIKDVSRRKSYPAAIGLWRGLGATFRLLGGFDVPAAARFLPPPRPPTARGGTSTTSSSVSPDVGFSGYANADGRGSYISKIRQSSSSSSEQSLNESRAGALPGAGAGPA